VIADLDKQIKAAIAAIEKELRDWDFFNPPRDA
jgi:hypothetical protein